jgi:phosphoribosylaminoimidazole carboxylase PurE protein
MNARVSVLMGSQSDLETVREALDVLAEFSVETETKVLSAHRTPEELAEYVKTSSGRGVKVFIAAAGGSAALAGVIAAHTVLPVIGIPIQTQTMGGLDSLLSTVQMPAGIPVASMAIGKGGARNAALFALAILGTSDEKIAQALLGYRARMKDKILKTEI